MPKDDYVLVRDKDGNLKYYKDGKFFDLADIKKTAVAAKNEPKPPAARIEIKPVPEDEEVAKHSRQEPLRQELNNKIQQAVDDIKAELKVSFAEPALEKRFNDLLASRLRGIRGDNEVQYRLTVPPDRGGLGLPVDQAVIVLAVIAKHDTSLSKEKKGLAARTADGRMPVVPRAISTRPYQEQSAKTIQPADKPMLVIGAEQSSASAPPAMVRKPVPRDPAKPDMDDVRYQPKLVGPLEELKTLDLENFRRLGSTVEQMTEEVREKIELLEQEEFMKRFLGVLAWRDSAVFNLYRDIGVQSILSGQPVTQVIVDRQVQNLPTLTQSEFEAIEELNKSLVI